METVQDLRLAGGGDRRIWAGRPAVEMGGYGCLFGAKLWWVTVQRERDNTYINFEGF